ncbi:hypothetical protein [Leptospira langatensis]|nr:hypothetical protein [Leptospira langatensis]
MKSFSLQDLTRAQMLNTFAIPKPTDPPDAIFELKDKEKFYVITGLDATGAWTISGKTGNKDESLRDYVRSGNGPIQFYQPIGLSEVIFTGVDKVFGYDIFAVTTL